MRAFSVLGLILGFLLGLSFITARAESDIESNVVSPTQRNPGITAQELQAVLSSDVVKAIERSETLSFSPDDSKFWAQKAKQVHQTAPVSEGDPGVKYDVIIQIGHFPRKTGKTGGQGKLVSEQEIAALIAVGLVQKLSTLEVNSKAIKALLVGADDFRPGLQSKIFLSLHTDSTTASPCSVKPSVGYEKIGDAKGMHAIALALAITLGLNAENFMKDNYTTNLSGYYAYKSFKTEHFKGLLEMSELSCPKQEVELLERAALLSSNLAVAVQFALR